MKSLWIARFIRFWTRCVWIFLFKFLSDDFFRTEPLNSPKSRRNYSFVQFFFSFRRSCFCEFSSSLNYFFIINFVVSSLKWRFLKTQRISSSAVKNTTEWNIFNQFQFCWLSLFSLASYAHIIMLMLWEKYISLSPRLSFLSLVLISISFRRETASGAVRKCGCECKFSVPRDIWIAEKI